MDFAAFLTKPIKQSHLYNVLLDVLGKQRIQVKPWHSAPPQINRQLAAQLPLRILLAEDNVVNRKVTLLLLQQMGYRADVANNGREVLEALHRQSYDVVLMDVQMPEMDGLTATRRICQEWSPAARPRIIAMSAVETNTKRGADLVKQVLSFAHRQECSTAPRAFRLAIVASGKPVTPVIFMPS